MLRFQPSVAFWLSNAKSYWLLLPLLGLLFRALTALSPYSGMQKPPMFGDFEAQRHFIEVAYNLPLLQWYRYDLKYWGLDYPPLTAYHSWLMGAIGDRIQPEWFMLLYSRGHESPGLKQFMRMTSIVSDLLVYGSAVVALVSVLSHAWKHHSAQHWKMFGVLLMLNPSLLVIDHGHFQYNSVMLGFILWSLYFILKERYFLASVCFCLSIGFKQMALYYALAIFFFLLGTCLSQEAISGKLRLLVTLASAVLLTFGGMLYPFKHFGDWNDVIQVLVRLFPFDRGLYEDKVANVWCAMSIFVKLRNMFPVSVLLRISTVATLLASLPACYFTFTRATVSSLLYALTTVSLAFFLFSFQVHEKSILIPLLPMVVLYLEEPVICDWFMNTAMFSMYHTLLQKDGLVMPYIGLLMLWNALTGFASIRMSHGFQRLCILTSYVAMGSIHAGAAFITPPAKLPDVFVVGNVLISTAVFLYIFVHLNIVQFMQMARQQEDKTKSE